MITIFKPYGFTPKEIVDFCIDKYNAKKGAFSGRLDPMACGVMNVYFDSACKQANIDDTLSKSYRFVMCFGLETTSGDLLGFPRSSLRDIGASAPQRSDTTVGGPSLRDITVGDSSLRDTVGDKKVTVEALHNAISIGEYMQKQPVHSSLPVAAEQPEVAGNKKQPLWWWALHNRLDEIVVPSFKRTLYEYNLIDFSEMRVSDIVNMAINRIDLINRKHMFRQDKIIDAWRQLEATNHLLQVAELQVDVSSGFYIRQLAQDIGGALGVKTVVLEIERTRYREATTREATGHLR